MRIHLGQADSRDKGQQASPVYRVSRTLHPDYWRSRERRADARKGIVVDVGGKVLKSRTLKVEALRVFGGVRDLQDVARGAGNLHQEVLIALAGQEPELTLDAIQLLDEPGRVANTEMGRLVDN